MPPWDDRERATLVTLLQERSQVVSWPGVAAEIIEAGSARSVWDAHHDQSLFDTETPAAIVEAARQIAGWRAAGLGVHTFRHVSYPAQLREIHQVPPVLFSRGTLHPGEPAVSVVGSRRACDQSVDWASKVSTALVSAGITVVSGLAAGIDTAAHIAALDAGGRTVAVVGTGINRVYPAANRDLQERIACEGLVLSQFWPEAKATKKSFPLRNATMSGYGRATIVVEAGEDQRCPDPGAGGCRAWPGGDPPRPRGAGERLGRSAAAPIRGARRVRCGRGVERRRRAAPRPR